MYFLKGIRSRIIIWFMAFLVLPFFLWWVCNAADDLLRQIFYPSYLEGTTFNVWENTDTVWNEVVGWWSIEVRIKFKKEVMRWDNNELLCHNGPCPDGCKEYDPSKDTEDQCNWQHHLVQVDAWKQPSMIVKVTRLLLSLVIALSVTMILYNWMQYIIQTWQWKEAKDLTKNIAYIVVWILVALFSVVIITLIQSIPATLDKELDGGNNNETDNTILENK